jgi:hypothetical protein
MLMAKIPKVVPDERIPEEDRIVGDPDTYLPIARMHLELGIAYYNQDRDDEAMDNLAAAVEIADLLAPIIQRAERIRTDACLYMAMWYTRQRKPKLVLHMVNQAVGSDSRQPQPTLQLAQ